MSFTKIEITSRGIDKLSLTIPCPQCGRMHDPADPEQTTFVEITGACEHDAYFKRGTGAREMHPDRTDQTTLVRARAKRYRCEHCRTEFRVWRDTKDIYDTEPPFDV